MLKRFTIPFLFLAFCAFTTCGAYAQKLYMFTGGDYRDETIGSAVGEANDLVRDTVNMNMPDGYVIHYNVNDTTNSEDVWTGPDMNRSENVHDDILDAIDRCPAEADDTIFFYWTGHGAYDDQGHYLLMPKGKGRPTMYRSEILEALKRKNVRLIVFITDSCHTYIPLICFSPGPGGEFQHLITDGVPLLYVNLFFQCKGVLDMNSSCPNQEAHLNPDNIDFKSGGTVFACAASEILENKRLESYDWKTFVDQINSRPLCRRFHQEAYVWEYPEKLPSHSISGSEIASTGTWEIVRVSPDGQFRTSYKPYGGSSYRTVGWSPYRYHPENGDRIVQINGKPITSTSDLQTVIAVAGTLVTLDLIGHRTGKRYQMRTHINPKGTDVRLGVYAEDDGGEGIRVTGVEPGSPCDRCSFYQDGKVMTVRGTARRGRGRPDGQSGNRPDVAP